MPSTQTSQYDLSPIHLTPSLCSYLHWPSDLFFSTLLQNIPTSPSSLLPTHQTKPSHLHTTGQAISTLSSSWNLTPLFPIPIFTSFLTASIYTLKSQEDTIQPCLIPSSILKYSLSQPFTLRQARLLTYTLLMPFNSLPPTSYVLT